MAEERGPAGVVEEEDDEEEEEEEGEEEEEEEEIRSSSSGGRPLILAIIWIGIVAVVAFGLGLANFADFDNVRQELGAKADATEVAQEILRLDNVKADRSNLEDVRSSVDTLVGVANTLNTRVVQAEENLGKNAQAAAAAASSARKASQLAKEAREQLARLDAESRAWQDSTASVLAGLPRKIDSRVGSVATELFTFGLAQAATNAAQDSVNSAHRAAIEAFRAELRLSDKDMARLAAELRKRQQRRSGRQ